MRRKPNNRTVFFTELQTLVAELECATPDLSSKVDDELAALLIRILGEVIRSRKARNIVATELICEGA